MTEPRHKAGDLFCHIAVKPRIKPIQQRKQKEYKHTPLTLSFEYGDL